MTRLWDKGAPLDARVLAYTAGEDYPLDDRLVRYDIRASIAHADMLAEQGLLSAADHGAIRDALAAIGEEHAQGKWRVTLDQEDCQTAIENLLTARIGAAGGRLHAGRSRNDQVLAALRLYLRDAAQALHDGAHRGGAGARRARGAQGSIVLPGYTHMQQAMPSTVALWALGFAAEIRDDAQGLAARAAARSEEPARLRRRIRHAESRSQPRIDAARPLEFEVTHEPVTAVQLSRGKAEAQLLFEITLLTQDIGRLAADLLAVLHAGVRFRESAGGVHHRFLHHAPEAQSGRVRADARAQRRGACGAQRGARHHRETRAPATIAICSSSSRRCSAASTPAARRSTSCRARSRASPFRPDKIRLDPGIDAAAAANALVAQEKIPFREAYQRVAAQSQGLASEHLAQRADARGRSTRSARGTMARPLGIVFTEIGEDFIRGTMPVDERTRQPYGLLHGGASVALAETLGSTGANLCVDRFPLLLLGQEINANHVRSARTGRVTGTARPLHIGGRSQVWGIDIVDEAGALVCVSRLTMAVVAKPRVGAESLRVAPATGADHAGI